MKNRKPFELKHTLIVYNLFQVLVSSYLFYLVRIITKYLEPVFVYIWKFYIFVIFFLFEGFNESMAHKI